MVEDLYKISRRDFVSRLAIISISLVMGSCPKTVLADIPAVALHATRIDGDEFEVTINVFHNGNTALHYVKKVVLFADGEEVKVWKYSWRKRPEAENFSVKTKVIVTKEIALSAVASCNQHGENEDRGRLILSPTQARE